MKLYLNGAKHSPWIFLISFSWGRGRNVDLNALTCLCIKVFLRSIFMWIFWGAAKILKHPSNEFLRKRLPSFENCPNLKKNDDNISNFDQKIWQKMMKKWKILKVSKSDPISFKRINTCIRIIFVIILLTLS